VVDLGCGQGATLAALASRLDHTSKLIGVDLKPATVAGEPFERIAADLNERLPFDDDTIDAAISQNVVEELRDPQAFISESARVLAPGGYLLLGHSDFDTLVFSGSNLALTRRLVHRFCDAVQPWMTVADGTVGRHLVALSRRSPLELVRTFAWVGHHTTFERGGPAYLAATLVANEGRRDPDLANCVDGWLADLEQQAAAGEFLYSINDYAVLLRKSF
jgi:SAM-dependent methyltransferase